MKVRMHWLDMLGTHFSFIGQWCDFDEWMEKSYGAYLNCLEHGYHVRLEFKEVK